mmetsp:Transcript_57262/g.170359  ORF Transcript_57262/g.170359 Transcript_57262/m.170359 type:complete len:486 (-) Transcript_57262:445-1902(-)
MLQIALCLLANPIVGYAQHLTQPRDGHRLACVRSHVHEGRGALEAPDHGPVELAEPRQGVGLLVRHVPGHREVAKGPQLHDHPLQEIHLLSQHAVGVDLPELAVVVGVAVVPHLPGRLEHRRGHVPHLVQQLLQRPQDDRGHGVAEVEGGSDHEGHDAEEEDDAQQGVDLVGPLEVELAPQAGALEHQPVGVALRTLPAAFPRQTCEHFGAQGRRRLCLQAVREVGHVLVEAGKHVELPREAARRVCQRVGGRVQHVHERLDGPVLLRVRPHAEQRQDNHQHDDEARHAHGQREVEPARDHFGGPLVAPEVPHARQEAQELDELGEAARASAQLGNARSPHDHGVLLDLRRIHVHDAAGDVCEVKHHGGSAKEVRPEEEGVEVGLHRADQLHEELQDEHDPDAREDDVEVVVAGPVRQDPDVRKKQRGEQGHEHHELELPVPVERKAEGCERPVKLAAERAPAEGRNPPRLLHGLQGGGAIVGAS